MRDLASESHIFLAVKCPLARVVFLFVSLGALMLLNERFPSVFLLWRVSLIVPSWMWDILLVVP
jgi:hypothetical protein